MNVNRGTKERQALPPSWRWAKLGEVCRISIGRTPRRNNPAYWGGNIPWVSISDISGDTVYTTREMITEIGVKQSSCRPVKAGTLLFSFKLSIGKMAYAGVDLYTNEAVAALTPIETTTLGLKFLRYALSSSDLTLGSSHAVKGRTLNQNSLNAIQFPLPPLSEQKRITAILNEQMMSVEKARAAAEVQLEAAKALPAAYLRRVFPKERQPLPPGWRWMKLGEHTVKIGSGLTPLGGHASYKHSGIPLIRSQNVHNNRFVKEGLVFISCGQDEEMENSRVIENDILLNITGASIGRVCVVPTEICPANVNQHVCIVRCNDEIFPAFLSFFVSTRDFQKHVLEAQAGATRQALTKALIEEFHIPTPPLAEQKRIAAALNEQMASAERLRNHIEKQLYEINSLPAVLLRMAFRGEL